MCTVANLLAQSILCFVSDCRESQIIGVDFDEKACIMYTMNGENNALIPTMISRVRLGLPFERINRDPAQLSVLALAYIGDTVYDMFVRTKLIDTTDLKPNGLHLQATRLVCARTQAQAFRRIESLLTDEENNIFRRGRNAHMGTIPKHAAIMDYRLATGLEAVIGWLYLKGCDERLAELMRIALNEDAAES